MKTLLYSLSLLILTMVVSYNCPDCTTPPESIALRIIDNTDSTDLIFRGRYSSDTMIVYYFENNIRKEVKLEIVSDTIKKQSVIYSNEIGWISAAGTKEYFLYLNHHETDTIYLDYEEKSDRCCTTFLCKEFSINGTELQRDNIDFLYYYFK